MKLFYRFILLSLLLPAVTRAQQQTATTEAPKSFMLEQCIQYALENSINVQNAIVDQQIAQAKVRDIRGQGLPQISGSASIVDNPKLPRFFTTYTGPQGIVDLSKVPGIQVGDVVAATNFFQLKSSGTASVTANQILFNGSYILGLQAATVYKSLSEKSTNQTREQLIQQVIKAYYNVLINRERLDLFTNNIARVDSLLRNTEALNKNGFAENIDVDRIKVTYNNLIAERDNFANQNDLGLALLKFQMNYPMDKPITVEGNIQDMDIKASLDEYTQDWDYKVRPDYQVLEVNRRLQELNVKNQYAAGLPSLNAFATYGYSTQSPNISGLFSTNSNIKDQGGVGPDKWYDFSQIGVSLSVPLFSGLQRHYKVQEEKLSLLKIQNNFRNLRNSIDLEVATASTNFKNAMKSLEAQKANMELASKVGKVTKIKYEQGVGSNLEVVDAENSLRQAQTNYYNALYNVMVAKVDLDKAYGKILPQYAATAQTN